MPESIKRCRCFSTMIRCTLLTFLRLESSRPRKSRDTKLHESFLDMEQQLDEIKGIKMVPGNIFCASLEGQIWETIERFKIAFTANGKREIRFLFS